MVTTRALSLCPGHFITGCKLKVNVLDCWNFRKIPPKRLIPNPSKSISSTGSIDCPIQTKRMTEKGGEMHNRAKIGGLVDHPDRIEAMTVKEIRAVMKDAGISIKGPKHEMLSTLRSYLNSNSPGNNDRSTKAKTLGSSSLRDVSLSDTTESKQKRNKRKTKSSTNINLTGPVTTEEKSVEFEVAGSEDPPSVEMLQNKVGSTKRKEPVSSSAGEVSILDTTESKQKRNKRKTQSSTNINLSGTVMTEEALVDSEVSGLKKSRSGKRTTLKVENSCESAVCEPWTVLMHKKPQPGWVPYNPKILRPPPLANDAKFMKLMSWNVNGLRALLKSDAFSVLQQKENFDVLCLQETKMQEKDVDAIKRCLFDGYDKYNSFWTCSITKLGYSGTAIISRIKPVSVSYGLGIEDHDAEGRLVTAEFENFYLLSGYVPNSGDGLRRLSYRINEWDPSLGKYMKDLEKLKPVILTGDLNCAHEEIDIYNPAGNRRSAGFTDDERESFNRNFLTRGFVDTFRKQHPSVVGYTYYGYRHGGRKTNKGWRLDYFLVSESMADQVHDSYIVPEIGGSDHCPIGLIMKV